MKRDDDFKVQLTLILIAAAAMLLAGCKTTTATNGIECAVWRPVTWSSRDTPETIAEVKANNARRKAWCEGKK